jgi:hypothetical protein
MVSHILAQAAIYAPPARGKVKEKQTISREARFDKTYTPKVGDVPLPSSFREGVIALIISTGMPLGWV